MLIKINPSRLSIEMPAKDWKYWKSILFTVNNQSVNICFLFSISKRLRITPSITQKDWKSVPLDWIFSQKNLSRWQEIENQSFRLNIQSGNLKILQVYRIAVKAGSKKKRKKTLRVITMERGENVLKYSLICNFIELSLYWNNIQRLPLLSSQYHTLFLPVYLIQKQESLSVHCRMPLIPEQQC